MQCKTVIAIEYICSYDLLQITYSEFIQGRDGKQKSIVTISSRPVCIIRLSLPVVLVGTDKSKAERDWPWLGLFSPDASCCFHATKLGGLVGARRICGRLKSPLLPPLLPINDTLSQIPLLGKKMHVSIHRTIQIFMSFPVSRIRTVLNRTLISKHRRILMTSKLP